MATISRDIIIASQSKTNSPEYNMTFLEASGQTFKKGWVVAIIGGYVSDAYNLGTPPAQIFGIAAQDATGTQGTQINVYSAWQGNVFTANVVSTSSLTAYVSVQSDIGGLFGIVRDTPNNRIYLDASVRSVAAGARAFVYGVAQGTSIGDTDPRYLFGFLDNFVQDAGTS